MHEVECSYKVIILLFTENQFLFSGALMMLDIPAERGLGEADLRWGDDNDCRFPLFNFLKPLPLEYMCMIYFIMWLGEYSFIIFVIPKTLLNGDS